MSPTLKGTSFILISALFYASYGVWSRLMGSTFGEFSQAWTRGLILLFVVALILLFTRSFKPIKRSDLVWFLGTGLAGGLNQAPYFYGFKYLGVGTATLLFYASLVIGGYLLGRLIFQERLTPVKLISLALALIGMLAIYRFDLTASQLLPALATVIAGLLGSATVILPKKLSAAYPESQIMASYFITQILINLPLALLLHDPLPVLALRSFHEGGWLPQLGYAASMLIANAAVINGFKYLESSIGSLIGLAEILFGLTFGVLLFTESIRPGTALGALLILTAAALPHLKSLQRRITNNLR